MGQPFVGEIRMFGGNFAPAGWMFCEGQTLPISENETLFQLIGTMYGGDGQQTFNLPDLRGRVPVHFGSGIQQAQASGVESVTLTTAQIPTHTHPQMAIDNTATEITPIGNVFARTQGDVYTSRPPDTVLAAATVGNVGGSQPHENMQPFLCISFIISLFGIFPSPS